MEKNFSVKNIDLSSTRKYVPIERVLPDLGQPRRRYERSRLEELAQSFKLHGQISFPMVECVKGREYRKYVNSLKDVDENTKRDVLKNVRDDESYYFLVVGHRRRYAAEMAGQQKFGVDVLEKRLSLLERRLIQIDEDSQLPLKSWRKAEELVRLFDFENAERKLNQKHPVTISEFSAHYGLSEESVRNALRYVRNLSPKAKKFVESGQLSYEKAAIISLLPSKDEQYRFVLSNGKSSYDNIKEKVHKRIINISRKNPKLAERKGLLPVVRAILAGKAAKSSEEEFFSVQEVDYSLKIKEVRDEAREIKDEIFRSLKLCLIDPEYKKKVYSIIQSKTHSALELIEKIEGEVRKYTDFMDRFNGSRPVNGQRVCYDTLADIIERIEADNPELIKTVKKRIVKNIPLKLIDPDPNNPRGRVTEEEIKDLAEAIRREGRLLNAVLVCKKRTRYMLIAGERRYRAAKLVPLKTIPCIPIDNLDQKLRLWLQKNENTQVPFTKSERARALSEIYDLAGANAIDELIETLQISRKTGIEELRYEKEVSKSVKLLVEEGLLSYSAASLFTNNSFKIEGKPLNEEQQLEIAYLSILRGKTSKPEFRDELKSFVQKLEEKRKQLTLIEVPLDKNAVYEKQAQNFSFFIDGFIYKLKEWTDKHMIKNVISADTYIMKYLCTIKKLLRNSGKKNHVRKAA